MTVWSPAIRRHYARPRRVPNPIRLNLAERVLLDRRVTSVNQIMHTVEQRVATQMSSRKSHTVLPLGKNEFGADKVQALARKILLEQRRRAAATITDKYGVPILTPLNGVGHFVLPLQRVLFTYCSHSGDSEGMKGFLSMQLKQLAEENPSVEFVVEPRWGHFPLMRGFYLNGYEKVLCVKNMNISEVKEEFMKLRNCSGKPPKPFHLGVTSKAPSVRPIWSPFHMLSGEKNDPLGSFRSKGSKQ